MKKIVYKTTSWRIISTVAYAGVAYWFTGSVAASASLVGIDAVWRTALYVAHEWAWESDDFKKMVYGQPGQPRAALLPHRHHRHY